MLKTLGSFITERAGSLVSKKLGAALTAEAAVAAVNPGMQGVPACAYIVSQAALEAFKFWATLKYGKAA